ncbi:MAG: putative polysaccharide biosynthesis protein [Sulfobacillus sp.]
MPKHFLRGAFLLAVAGFLTSVLGLYRLLLPALIGAQGVGLYQMAYPIYGILFILSTGGLPVAISKMVADRLARGEVAGSGRVFRLSMRALGLGGLVLGVAMAASAGTLAANVARDPRATLSILAISPAIVLTGLAAVWRGHFQGRQDMVPTALSQLVDQAVRVVFIVVLVVVLKPYGLAVQAAGATFAAVIGMAADLAVLMAYRRRHPVPAAGTDRTPDRHLLGELLLLALPVAAATLVVPLMQLGDLVLVPTLLLHSGLALSARTALYGELSGYAFPVMLLPSVATFAVAVAIVPSLAEAAARGDRPTLIRRSADGLRATAMVAIPSTIGLWVLGTPIMVLLFHTPTAGPMLTMLALSVLGLGLLQVGAGILQGVGRANLPLYGICAGFVLKMVLTVVLMPTMGVAGAALATSVGMLAAGTITLLLAWRLIGTPIWLKDGLLRPMAGVPLMAAVLWWTTSHPGLAGSHSRLWGLIEVLAGACAYALGSLVMGGWSRQERAHLLRHPLATLMGRDR